MKNNIAVGCLLFSLAVACIAGDRWLVRLSKSDTQSCPAGWPVEVAKADDERTVIGWDTNLTSKELDIVISNLRPRYDAITTQQEALREGEKKTRFDRLESLFDDFKTYADEWTAGTNYSNARLNKIVEDHNRAFLILRPILRDLYQSRE